MTYQKASIRKPIAEADTAIPAYPHSLILSPGRRNVSRRRFPLLALICWLLIFVLVAAAVWEIFH